MKETVIIEYIPQLQEEGKQEEKIVVGVEYEVTHDIEAETYKCTVVQHEKELPVWLKPTYFEIKVTPPTKDNNTYLVGYPNMDNIDARLFTYEVYMKLYAKECYKLMTK